MTELHKSKPFVWGVFLVFCLVWFYALGARTLVPTDEGRYAEMAREMLATGDWITTRLNGIKYFEKPPLQTWMNALTFAAFGLGEWQARLWTGLCGLFGVVFTAFAGRRVFGERIGFNAGVALGASFMWAALSHVNTLDMGLSAMMTLTLGSLLLAQRNDPSANGRRNWMLTCWAGMALAVLSKGLIGIVLPGAVLVLYTLVSRDWAIWKRLHLKAGLLAFLVITAPWFILVSLKNPEFPHFFFIHEHFQRFTSKVHHREGAWYYFFPTLILGAIPWLALLPQSLWNAAREQAAGFQPGKLLLIWSVFIFFFFSISGSKLPSYILPIFPALALLIACQFERTSAKVLFVNAALFAAMCGAGLAVVQRLPALNTPSFEQALYQAYLPWVVAAAALGVAGSLLAIVTIKHRQLSILTLAFTGFLCSQALMLGHEPLGSYKAGVMHVAAVKAELGPDTPIYAVRIYEQSLPFYLRHKLILVEFADEMEFGVQQEPRLWIPKLDHFLAQWKADTAAGKKAIAIVHPDAYPILQESGLPMRIIAQDPRRIIVTNNVKSTPAS